MLAGGVGRGGEHVADAGDASSARQVQHYAVAAGITGHVLEGQLNAEVRALLLRKKNRSFFSNSRVVDRLNLNTHDVDVVEPLPVLLPGDAGSVDQDVRGRTEPLLTPGEAGLKCWESWNQLPSLSTASINTAHYFISLFFFEITFGLNFSPSNCFLSVTSHLA